MERQGLGGPDNRRKVGAGRRLRVALAMTAALLAGAATLTTALAHSGTVTASETCTTWQAAAALNNNVTIDRIVDVVVSPPSLATGLTGLNIDTKGNPGPVQIWSAHGSAPATGTFTLNIYKSVGDLGKQRIFPAEFTASANIQPAPNCASTPKIETTPSSRAVTIGTTIHDRATVTGSSTSPTGTVIFSLFAPDNPTCSSTGAGPVFTSSPVDLHAGANGVSTATGSGYAPTAVGTYHWVAAYSGDGHLYNPVASECSQEAVVVGQATPTIATTQSAGGPLGVSISDTATVSGGVNPTGTVTFKLYGPADDACAGTPLATSMGQLTGGKADSASFTTTASSGVGTYRWVATYSGDANNKSVSSGCQDEAVVVAQAAPTISTSQSAGGNIGVAISDTATVSGGINPTGTVTFKLYGPTDATCSATPLAVSTGDLTNGKATSASFTTTTTSGAGTYRWIATYSGDANNAGASSGCQDEAVVINGGGGVQGITTPGTGDTSGLTGITVGGFLLLGGLGVALVSAIVPRRRAG